MREASGASTSAWVRSWFVRCDRVITATTAPGTNQMMGGFWSSISQKTFGKGKAAQRTDADQARMQMLQQYIAAVLNGVQFGSTPDSFGTSLSSALATYCDDSSTGNQIRVKAGQLGAFNESGDAGIFNPGVNATAPLSKQQAFLPFWDNPRTHSPF